jgi:hypothetical protein
MLVGRIPFEIKSSLDLHKIVTTKVVYPNTMSPEGLSFLQGLLVKDPANRKGIA